MILKRHVSCFLNDTDDFHGSSSAMEERKTPLSTDLESFSCRSAQKTRESPGLWEPVDSELKDLVCRMICLEVRSSAADHSSLPGRHSSTLGSMYKGIVNVYARRCWRRPAMARDRDRDRDRITGERCVGLASGVHRVYAESAISCPVLVVQAR